jgi:hypothetical protein
LQDSKLNDYAKEAVFFVGESSREKDAVAARNLIKKGPQESSSQNSLCRREANGGDALMFAPPPTHPLPTADCSQVLSKNLNP